MRIENDWLSIHLLLIYLSIHLCHKIIKHPLYARHCASSWEMRDKESQPSRDPQSSGAVSLIILSWH